jgi:tetratricopeptide (TPR) repeat protein
MKVYFILPLIFIVSPLLAQENLRIGQDLRAYFHDHPPIGKTIGPEIINMKEGRIDFFKYRPVTTDEDIKILVVNDKYPIGVLEKIGEKSVILLDLSGDGKLDTEFPTLFIPYWVVAESASSTLKTKNNNLKQILNTFYNNFDDDPNPYESGKHRSELTAVLQSAQNENMENRDLFYAIFCYYYLGREFAQQELVALDYLRRNYYERFKESHLLFDLHEMECLINLNDYDSARKILSRLLAVDPDFIPALVYQWQLEKDPEKKAEYYKRLKKDHPKHWIVKQI